MEAGGAVVSGVNWLGFASIDANPMVLIPEIARMFFPRLPLSLLRLFRQQGEHTDGIKKGPVFNTDPSNSITHVILSVMPSYYEISPLSVFAAYQG